MQTHPSIVRDPAKVIGVPLLIVFIAVMAWLLCGCVTRSVTVTQGTTSFTIKGQRPGWPWTVEALDVSKLVVTARTNGTISFGAAGAMDQTSNTNFNALIEAVAAGVVKGVMAGMKP